MFLVSVQRHVSVPFALVSTVLSSLNDNYCLHVPCPTYFPYLKSNLKRKRNIREAFQKTKKYVVNKIRISHSKGKLRDAKKISLFNAKIAIFCSTQYFFCAKK